MAFEDLTFNEEIKQKARDKHLPFHRIFKNEFGVCLFLDDDNWCYFKDETLEELISNPFKL